MWRFTSARDAIADLLRSDPARRAAFRRACESGTVALLDEIGGYRRALDAAGVHYEGGVGDALFDLAFVLLPGTPAAGRGRLRQRVRVRIGYDLDRRTRIPVDTTDLEAVEVLVAAEWAVFADLARRSESAGDEELMLCAGTIQDALREHGRRPDRRSLPDVVRAVLRGIFPGCPAAGWDYEWAVDLYRRTEAYLDEQGIREALTTDEEATHVERVFRAIKDGDRTGYRRALQEWMAAAREAANSESSPSA